MLRILIIEDDKSNQEVLKGFLNMIAEELNQEFQIDVADDGTIGSDMYGEKNYDIVFTDIKMSVMNGDEILNYIESRNPDQVVIAITGSGFAESKKVFTTKYLIVIFKSPLITIF